MSIDRRLPLDPPRVDNPFCARRIQPGAIPFFFPPGVALADVLARLEQVGWRGQIVGPHGSGKSALLESLIPAIEAAGHPVVRFTLHDGQPRISDFARHVIAPGTILVIDGYEQLSLWQRLKVRWRCQAQRLGLLVTCHRPCRLPLVYQTTVDLELASRVVSHLLVGQTGRITPDDLAGRLAVHKGNLRETLFDLYDLYESRGS